MNLQKVIIIAVAAVLLIGGWMYFTRVDRTNPIAVATAFTKALKGKDTSKASGYFVPDQAKSWQASADATIGTMKSGSLTRYYEAIPDSPAFGAPTTANGVTSIQTSDNSYHLDMTQIDGKWYVSKAPI